MASTPVVLDDYLSAGYFLSRLVEPPRPGHRAVTLGHDHSPRRFFPESWTLSWCRESDEDRVRGARAFGLAEADLGRLMAWADGAFGKEFGAWDVVFRIEDARAIAGMFLSHAPGLELWGLGVERSVLDGLREGTAPRPEAPGYAPAGASGVHLAAEMGHPLPPGGVPLGHEILLAGVGCSSLRDAQGIDGLGLPPLLHGLMPAPRLPAPPGARRWTSAGSIRAVA